MRRRLWTALALLGVALAHPVDEVVQGAYLTLTPGAVQLELDVSPGTQVVAGVLNVLDANGDRTISPAEARAYGLRVLSQSSLTLDGVAAQWTLDRVSVPPYQNLLAAGEVLKLYATAKRVDSAGPHTLSYQNRYTPAKSQWIANIFLRPAGSWQYQVTGQTHRNEGRGLTVKYTVSRP